MERFSSQFRKGKWKYFRKSPRTLYHVIVPPNRVVLSLFPPLARGATLDMLSSSNDWFDG